MAIGLTSTSAATRAKVAAKLGLISPTPTVKVKAAATKPAAAAANPLGPLGANPYDTPVDYGTNPYTSIIAKYGTVPTQQSLLSNAKQAVASALAPTLADLKASGALETRQLANQATRAQEFAKALAAMNLRQAPQTVGEYNQAADTLAAVGSGLSGTLASDWQGQTQAVQNAVNQMTGGLPGQEVGGYDAGRAADVNQMLGAVLPARDIVTQGLHEGSLLRAQSAADVGAIGNVALDYRSKLADALAQQEADRAKVIGQRPELLQKALESGRAERADAIKTLTSMTGASADWAASVANAQAKQAQNAANWEIDAVNAATKQASAQAYSDSLSGKINSTNYGLKLKAIHDAADIKIKGINNAANIKIKQANARTSRITANASAQRAQTATALAEAGTWLNPKTSQIEKIPAGTYIGADGLPHKVKGSSTSTTSPAGRFNDLNDLDTAMRKDIRTRLNVGGLVGKHSYWDVPRIKAYLMRNFGSGYLATYSTPEARRAVNAKIDAIAQSIVGQYPKDWRTRGKKQANLRAK